ncbi:hypothetical protein QTH87_24565 [Variovorax sp. J22P168]|uniref:hypothetical protein n=1 Tax=Variovorax jilinensis TaxID=3053513 RepID=UPI002574DB45|nr:hypothetical protein [Variovorax sp. J22P168]MDM0015634.1 hypothetical protein [Variovorax sp. J22P168]
MAAADAVAGMRLNPNGSRDADPARSAEAFAWGFGATAIAVRLALALAWWLLPREPAAKAGR